MTGKERAYLKKLAHGKKAILQMGKEGMSEAFLKELDAVFEQFELVKIDLLPSAGEEKKELTEALLEKTGAQFISQVGRKLVLYRESTSLPRQERLNPSRKA